METPRINYQKGFTLIELMIVVAIIGILAATAIPTYGQFRTKAFNSAAAADAHHLFTFENLFFDDHREYVTVTTSDKQSDGSVSKAVTINGQSVQFTITTLTPNVDILCKTNGTKQTVLCATLHTSGDKIVAIDLESPGSTRYKASTQLQSSDVPDATMNFDLGSWASN